MNITNTDLGISPAVGVILLIGITAAVATKPTALAVA